MLDRVNKIQSQIEAIKRLSEAVNERQIELLPQLMDAIHFGKLSGSLRDEANRLFDEAEVIMQQAHSPSDSLPAPDEALPANTD